MIMEKNIQYVSVVPHNHFVRKFLNHERNHKTRVFHHVQGERGGHVRSAQGDPRLPPEVGARGLEKSGSSEQMIAHFFLWPSNNEVFDD